MTSRHNLIVIAAAAIISIAICSFAILHARKKPGQLSAKTFHGAIGWGYDILVNDSLFIHQEFVPQQTGRHGFTTEKEALQTAELLIQQLQVGHRNFYQDGKP